MIYIKNAENNSIIGTVPPKNMNTIHTNGINSHLVPNSSDTNFSHYIYTAYVIPRQSKLQPIAKDNDCSGGIDKCRRINYSSELIKAGDVIYFDYTIDKPVNNVDFNDSSILYSSIKTNDNYYRVFGLYTITQYDITGIAGGRLYDYDKLRFFDLNVTQTSSNIIEDYAYKNPTIHNGPFTSYLQTYNTSTHATFYKIEAVDWAGNVSPATYVLLEF